MTMPEQPDPVAVANRPWRHGPFTLRYVKHRKMLGWQVLFDGKLDSEHGHFDYAWRRITQLIATDSSALAAEWLVAWRTERHWTTAEAASYWSVAESTYRRWERRGPPQWVTTEDHGRRTHDARLLAPPIPR